MAFQPEMSQPFSEFMAYFNAKVADKQLLKEVTKLAKDWAIIVAQDQGDMSENIKLTLRVYFSKSWQVSKSLRIGLLVIYTSWGASHRRSLANSSSWRRLVRRKSVRGRNPKLACTWKCSTRRL